MRVGCRNAGSGNVQSRELARKCDKKRRTIVRGDSYGQASPSHPAIVVPAPGVADSVATLTVRNLSDELALEIQGMVTGEEARFSFSGILTKDLSICPYKYDVQAGAGMSIQTIELGTLEVCEDQTR